MPNQVQTKPQIISGLLAPYPPSGSGTTREISAAYLAAVIDIPEQFVGEAARRFNAGLVERTNLAFAPTPPQLAEEARRLWYDALRVQQTRRDRLLAMDRSDDEISDEEKARRKKFVEETLAGVGMALRNVPKGSKRHNGK